MARKEANLASKCNLLISEYGGRVRRNNVGYDREKKMSYGLGVGSSDFIGWMPVSDRAVILAVEYKTPGVRTTEQQRNFLEQVAKAGGIAIIGRGADQIRAAMEALKNGTYPWGTVYE